MANKLLSYIRTKTGDKNSTRRGAVAPYIKAHGLKHDAFFQRIHQAFLFDWYMEIGCRSGAIFSQARGKTVAVDPYFQVTRNVIGPKPALHLFQTKSDDFFESGFLKQNAIAVSASFLDGMHLMEYLLRDFINTERNSHRNGVIAMHDCCPSDAMMTTRDLKNLPTGSWTGDVWKMLPILQKYRPDLKITVVNCAHTGLVLVSDLDPLSDVLSANYEAILESYLDMGLAGYGVEKFFASFVFVDAQSYLDKGAKDFARAAMDPVHELSPVFITP